MTAPVHETAVRATGVLADFNTSGVLAVADVNVAVSIAQLCREPSPDNTLALALTVRALRGGSVCLDLTSVAEDGFDVEEALVDTAALPWPEPGRWLQGLRESPMVRVEPTADADAPAPSGGGVGTGPDDDEPRPLRLLGSRLYLDRYFEHEESVRSQLLRRRRATPPGVDLDRVEALLDRLFDRADLATDEPNWQRIAAANSVLNWVSVVAGGPGTGKTTTVAKVLASLQALHEGRLRITLAAPTGKAAARLEEAVRAESARLPEDLRAPLSGLTATTLHRVLGWRPESRTRFRHDAAHPLPWDVIVLDEMSMVSLPMMARLLEATRSGTRVILVGDPDQLTSVEAGAVMADVTHADSNRQPVPVDDPRWRALLHVHADDRQPSPRRTTPLATDGRVGAASNGTPGALSGGTTDPAPAGAPGALSAGRSRIPDLQPVAAAGSAPAQGTAAEGPGETVPPSMSAVVRGVVELTHTWRFGHEIGALARAVRAGDAEAALAVLRAGGDHVGWVEADLSETDPVAFPELRAVVQRTGRSVVDRAREGDAAGAVSAMEQHRVLCAHRAGPFGVARWSHTVEEWLREEVPGYGEEGEWYLGRPLLVTANDPEIGLYNGDTGVVVDTPRGAQAAFARGQQPTIHPLIHLDAVQSVHAMTVHKAQGSQFGEVTFVLPPLESALLTRELLYTAVTRARERVEIIGTEDALRQAIQRPVNRASGLRQRL
ncbi:AAA family ATPase [Auraticoccus monumenti]|uniref:RecBCD enzyme subunit RecD n=1 Tax=Auraticoccus monumenti TaxID=675864 RepID=A0A1G7AKB7_9ACTN|nr:AAA family ATPase [Auraticoccus monumenti]SDE15261.1 exodeoxyribonuclease V alpha subunit [Auraticoccus monumenti]